MQAKPDTSAHFDYITPILFFSPPILVITIVLAFIALLFGQKEMALFTLLIIAVASGLKLWSLLSGQKVHYHTETARQQVFPGESFALSISIKNSKFIPIFFKMRIPLSDFDPADGDPAAIKAEGGLLWHQKTVFKKVLTAKRRGVFPIAAPALATGDLFGVFPRRHPVSHRHEIIVYPRIVPLKPVALLKQIIFGKPSAASPVCDPIYFLGTTDYQQHRPARHIHWKASARHNCLQEKLFEPVAQDKVLLVFEVDQFYEHEAWDEFENALEVLASLAIELQAQKYSIGLLVNGLQTGEGSTYLPMAANPSRLCELLEVTARLKPKPIMPIKDLFEKLPAMTKNASWVYFSYSAKAAIESLHKKHIRVTQLVCGDGKNDPNTIFQDRICYLKDICIKDTHA
jgi:uncharacterized protein (DUF58 family)